MQRARLKDIAERVGCSIAVVSHVVNQSAGNISCRNELRDRILETAAELDYAPHYASRALKSQSAQTIGIYIPPRAGASIGFTYESTIMMGIERVCREKAYDLLVISTGQDVSHDAECAAKLNARRVDGLILLHVDADAWLFPLAEKNRNVVAVNYYGEARVDTINFHDETASVMAVDELHRAGHRRLCYVGPLHPAAGRGAELRLRGFLSACEKHGIPAGSILVFDETMPEPLPLGRNDLPEARVAERLAEHIASLPLERRPTALVGYSDNCVILTLRALRRLGFRLPEDLSAVGIDDSAICDYMQPRLSSIHQPLAEMGAEAARHIIEKSEARQLETTPLGTPMSTPEHWFKLAAPTFTARESILPPHT